jgi:hypothetical protein
VREKGGADRGHGAVNKHVVAVALDKRRFPDKRRAEHDDLQIDRLSLIYMKKSAKGEVTID